MTPDGLLEFARLPTAGGGVFVGLVPAERKFRLLIVDDDEAMRALLKGAAEACGAFGSIRTEHDPRAALRFLTDATRSDDRPDIVVTDLNMPRLDGINFVRELKAKSDAARICVAMLSSSDLAADRDAAIAAGCAVFLGKPAAIDELIAILSSLPGLCG
jgi:CheY-like chemotaxis protein